MSGGRTENFLSFIRFSHTIFAMPFALGALFVAAGGMPDLKLLGLVVVAMVFARTAAMTFNRLADWEIDKRNPRTQQRHRLASRTTAIAACVVSSILFAVTAWFINPLCFALSPVALIVVFFYSLTKRFTDAAQFFLGLALSVAPVGAWIAVTGSFAWPPLILALGVVLWVAGFDMIYATQDYEVDVREGLHSMVVRLGIPGALNLSVVLHGLAWVAFLGFGLSAGLGAVYYGALALMAVVLVWEQLLARKRDIGAINRAFFQANAVVGVLFVASTLIDGILR